jgi:hypothetical protein
MGRRALRSDHGIRCELVTGKRARTAPAADRVFEQARQESALRNIAELPETSRSWDAFPTAREFHANGGDSRIASRGPGARGETNRERTDRIMSASPLASPMTPDHPGWLEPGEHVITFTGRKPKPE